MTDPTIPDHDFIRLFETIGPRELARQCKVSFRAVYKRRENLERKVRRQITSPESEAKRSTRHNIEHAARLHFDIENGVVLVGSDAHIWPGPMTTAMRAFIKFAKEMKPKALILNGDVMDHPQISRHPPIGWEDHPTVEQEIRAAQEQLRQIEDAVSPKCKLYWPLGNHDQRFETRLAVAAPEFARVRGFSLKDHFPNWSCCWAVWLNNDVVVKHRYKGGIHATHNATMWSGKTIVTGHLHSLKVTPFSDYSPRPRWGVDTGCLAEPNGPQFIEYSEDNPKNHRSGFVVLTFKNGVLLWPEVVHVFGENAVEYRGEVIKV